MMIKKKIPNELTKQGETLTPYVKGKTMRTGDDFKKYTF